MFILSTTIKFLYNFKFLRSFLKYILYVDRITFYFNKKHKTAIH